MGLMEALSGWLRQIVAVVLLAALVDLVLPNRTMQRYVRLVAGLIILLTIATPVLQWIRGDFDSKLAASMQAMELNPQSAPDELARIEEEGRKWRERSSLEAASLTATRLQEEIRKDVGLAVGREPANVVVELQRVSGGGLEVRQVSVTLAASDADAAAGESAEEAMGTPKPSSPPASSTLGVPPVEAVQPVTVAEPRPVSAGEERAPDRPAPDPAVRSRITALIAARYGIPAERIEIASGSGGQGR